MEKIKLETVIEKLTADELNEAETSLINAAKNETRKSYAPYSGFNVGAAVLLDNGVTISGTNQENAAYPSGMCAERTAVFYANSQYPENAVVAIAIAAWNGNDFTDEPVTPCGSCRQVLLEAEKRFNSSVTYYLYGMKYIYKIEGTKNLLPLSFGDEYLK